MTKLEQLKKEIQRLRPEIMELKFGCKVQLKEDVSIGRVKYYCIVKREKESYQLYNSRNGSVFWKTKQNFYEILGRPITLEDVLSVLGEKLNSEFRDTYFFEDGYFCFGDLKWKLGESFDNQSQEFHDNLYIILCQTENI